MHSIHLMNAILRTIECFLQFLMEEALNSTAKTIAPSPLVPVLDQQNWCECLISLNSNF